MWTPSAQLSGLPCTATVLNPRTGQWVSCTLPPGRHRFGHCYDRVARVHWPAAENTCQSWTIVPTAQGDAVLYCFLPAQPRHSDHVGYIGIAPTHWSDRPVDPGKLKR